MSLPAYQSQAQAYQAGLPVLAPYLDASALNTLSRVNTTFFRVFGSYLWSDPTKILSRSRTPYTKTIKFITQQHQERFSDLVRVLDFHPLVVLKNHGEFISDFIPNERYFNCQFIFNHVTYFRNLQFIVVDDVQMWKSSYFLDEKRPRYNTKLSLLSVSGSVLLDSSSVLEADYFTNLMYLDISGTYHAAAAMASLSHHEFGNLRVLKMRNLRLTKLPLFILGLGLRLWSLDVSSNLLTDSAIDALALHCIKPAVGRPEALALPVPDIAYFEYPPEYTAHGDVHDDLPSCRPDSTTPFVEEILKNQNAISSSLYALTGLTQLYISNNKITAYATRVLLGSTNRLQVLDLGALISNLDPSRFSTQHATVYHARGPLLMPCSRLERLRVHHSLVTHVPTITLGSPTHYHTAYVDAAERFAVHDATEQRPCYDPLQNHRITHLILTDIPTRSHGILIEHLVTLLRQLAIQSQAIEEVRRTTTRHHRSPALLPGLRQLRLEFMHEDGSGAPPSSSSVSVSGDRDADTFVERSRGDFSFFTRGEAGESSGRGKNGEGEKKKEKNERVLRDVVAEMKAWREMEIPRWPGMLQLVVPVRSRGY